MKKIFILTLLFGVLGLQAYAQDAKKMFKDASKAYGNYEVGAENAEELITEAKQLIEQVLQDPEYKQDADAWLLKGQIYQGMAERNTLEAVQSNEIMYPGAGVEALEAYKKALEIADKRSDQSTALRQIAQLAGQLSTIGNHYINKQEYGKAYKPLKAVYEANELLTKNEQESLFNTEEDRVSHLYAVAATASAAGDNAEAKKIYYKMIDQGSADPKVYSNLFNLLVDEDEEEALRVLRRGQELDPDNIDLLYAEINYLIKKEDYKTLEEKLKLAIEKNPDNPSVYLALGNVYSKLGEEQIQLGNSAEADEYNDQALQYFNKALEINPQADEALYMIGSIYFNKGAALTKKMSELGLSKEDQKKYEELDTRVHELFNKALPYFQKAEAVDPNDRNTIYALKEIYARLNNFELSNKFKERLERIDAGETIGESYFQE